MLSAIYSTSANSAHQMNFKLIVTCFYFASLTLASAQTYIGISANFGNQVQYTSYEGFRRPFTISGNVALSIQRHLNNSWVIQYNAGIGVMAYNVKARSVDTLYSWRDTFPFPDYSTVYGKLGVSIGKEISVGKKKLLLSVGGGATYYYSFYDWSFVSVWVSSDSGGSDQQLFSGELQPAKKFSPYANASAQWKLNNRFSLGLEYATHFRPVTKGTYEFYHTKTPMSGNIAVYQREISLLFLVRISKSKSSS